MSIEIPHNVSSPALQQFILSLADDELILGHRNAEWTGHAPILEEDIAFSNIAQDELGHSLVWYSLLESMTGRTPDAAAFERPWNEFTCCRFVANPKGDFAYTVVRQYLFDAAEQVRLQAFLTSSFGEFRNIALKLLREESYHLLHSRGLVERLGDATEESHRRMQAALDVALPQAEGMFEELADERELIAGNVFPGNAALRKQWLEAVTPVLTGATLTVSRTTQAVDKDALGGRTMHHHDHLRALVEDLQSVYRLVPGGKW